MSRTDAIVKNASADARALQPDAATMRAHIEWLVAPVRDDRPDLRFEIAYTSDSCDGRIDRGRTFRLDEIDAAIAFAARVNRGARNVYIGALLKSPDTPGEGRTSSAHAAVATALALDFDRECNSGLKKLREIAKLQLAVQTGSVPELRGQAWIRLAPTSDLTLWETTLDALITQCGADVSAKGVARLMRLAGSVNYPSAKKETNGYVVELTEMKTATGRKYALEELAEKLPQLPIATGASKASKSNKNAPALEKLGAMPNHILTADFQEQMPPEHDDALPPPDVEEMREMLAHLNEHGGFKTRDAWVRAGMALKLAYGEEIGLDLWATTHEDVRARADAPEQWKSFASSPSPGQTTIASLIARATELGFVRWRDRPAKAVAAEGDGPSFVSVGPYTMDPHEGLTKKVVSTRGKAHTIETLWISAAFEIIGQCRNPHGSEWGAMLRFKDSDRRVHLQFVENASLHGDPGALCAALARVGMQISTDRHKEFAGYLNRAGARAKRRVTVVNRTGWHEISGKRVFVLPNNSIGAEGLGESVVLVDGARSPYETQGSLNDWQAGVGALSKGQTLPTLAISLALAGPLAELMGVEGGGVHLYGPSSIGKSSLLCAAASVWGRGSERDGFVKTWLSTANALEGVAALSTDTLLALDELGVGNAADVSRSVYQLANGAGKGRSRRDASLADAKSWRITILSSGEQPIAQKIAEEKGRAAQAGQMVRILSIPADRGLGFGAFDTAGGFDDPRLLADKIKEAAASSYGAAGPEFVRRLLSTDLNGVLREAQSQINMFVSAGRPAEGGGEQIQRAAKRLALAAVAGELATKLGLTPWEPGDALRAAKWARRQWIAQRGGARSHEENSALERVRSILEQYGDSRFEEVLKEGNILSSTVRDRLGWRKGHGLDREWWILPETWKGEICRGLDPNTVAKMLDARGMLRRDEDQKNLKPKVKIDGQWQRAVVVKGCIMGDEEEADR